ncbi:MAG: hypothetical protein Q4C61_13535 [Lachnospiraceae bacterium]|nr:hypothetical protein [Lachnospiraceae bacterium]
MPAHISNSSYDASSMTLVPVIVSFDTSGNMRPLYLGVYGESHKILSSYCTQNYDFRIFKCQIEDHGTARNIILTFHPRECFWTIPKLPERRD